MKTSDLRDIGPMAERDFKDHVLTGPDEDGAFTCGKPNDGNLRFRIAFQPGLTIFWGDLGEAMIWRPMRDTHQTLGWLRGAVNSLGYVLEKMARAHGDGRWLTREEYHAGTLEENLDEWLSDGCIDQKQRDAMTDAIRHADSYGGTSAIHMVNVAASEAGIDTSEGLPCTRTDNRTLWQVAALRKFVELFEAQRVQVFARINGRNPRPLFDAATTHLANAWNALRNVAGREDTSVRMGGLSAFAAARKVAGDAAQAIEDANILNELRAASKGGD